MKSKILILCSLLIQIWTFSQENKTEDDIKKFTARIDSIVTAEKAKMNKEMEQVDKNFHNLMISTEQKFSQKKAIADKYEKIINDKIDAQNVELQKITKNTAVNSLYKKEGDSAKTKTEVILYPSKNSVIQISRSKKDNSPKAKLKTNDLVLSYSFLNLTKNAGSLNPFESDSKMRIGNSHSFEIQVRRERQIGNYESPVFIRYGLAYRSDTYMPKRPLVFVQNNEQLYLEDFTDRTLKRSKLRNVYLTFPVEFQFVLNPKYVEYEGKNYLDATKRQFRIGTGIYAGVNLRNLVKVKYYNTQNKFDKYQYTLDYGVNPFLFGAKFSISYGGFNLFIKKDITPIFDGKANLPSKNGIHFGLDISDLNF